MWAVQVCWYLKLASSASLVRNNCNQWCQISSGIQMDISCFSMLPDQADHPCHHSSKIHVFLMSSTLATVQIWQLKFYKSATVCVYVRVISLHTASLSTHIICDDKLNLSKWCAFLISILVINSFLLSYGCYMRDSKWYTFQEQCVPCVSRNLSKHSCNVIDDINLKCQGGIRFRIGVFISVTWYIFVFINC